MNALQKVFEYKSGRQVRTVIIDGEPWFVAKDVADVLGLSDSRKSVNLLDEDERSIIPVTDSLGRQQETFIINEPGLYSMILRSRKPEAKAFKRWVTHEVLPEIRKTGSYQGKHKVPQTFAEALRLAADQAEEIERLEAEKKVMLPKVEAYEDYMEANGAIKMENVAKLMQDVAPGIGRNSLFRFLRQEKVLQTTNVNVPYQRYMKYFKVVARTYTRPDGESVPTQTTMVRPEGVEFIRKLLKERWEK
jgi:anti-repressor protein